MNNLHTFLLSLWARRVDEGEEVWVWAPWNDLVVNARTHLGEHIRELPLHRPARTREGKLVRSWWVPWEGPRVHRPVPLTPGTPALPEPEEIWESGIRVVRGKLPLRRVTWPPARREDLYALVVLLRDRLPESLVVGWLAHYSTRPRRFEEETTEYLERFFRDPQHVRALKESFPVSFEISSDGWVWEVPDVPRYVRWLDRLPPWIQVEVALLPEHLPVFLERMARYRPQDLFRDSPLLWPPEPRGWTRSPYHEPWVRFSGGWAWVPEAWLADSEKFQVVPVIRGRHPVPGVQIVSSCGHPLPPPEEHEERVLRVNGFTLTLGKNVDDLPPLGEVERFRVHVEDHPDREVLPPGPLTVADLVRGTPDERLPRLPHLVDVLVGAGILLAPLTREVHGEVPFSEVARRLIRRFLGKDDLYRERPLDPAPGELVPVAPLLPPDLPELFARRVDWRELERVWDRIIRRFMAHFMPPARIREIRIQVTYRRKPVAERVVPVGVVEPGFTLAEPLSLHPFRGGKLVPVRIDVVRTRLSLSERLARLAALCPETPLRDLVKRVS